MKCKHLLTLCLTLTMLLSTLPFAAAAEGDDWLIPRMRDYAAFTDTAGTICEEAADICCKAGLMDGVDSRHFLPQSGLTHAQIIVISARFHRLLSGGTLDYFEPISLTGADWWTPYDGYLRQEIPSLASSEDYAAMTQTPTGSCHRGEFLTLLAAVLKDTGTTLPEINQVSAVPDCQDPDLIAFYRWGVLSGKDEYGTLEEDAALTRAAAAAMLARIVDPSLRVRFTPKPLVLSQALLDEDPDEVMMTVDGFDVTAGLYALQLSYEISEQTISHYFSRYDNYPEEYSAYLMDEEFRGDFAEYMMEKYGIDVSVPIDWDAPDKGGMSPAQKVLADTREECIRTAVLMNHQTEYPPTQAQQADMESFSYLSDYMGITRDVYETMYISECVWINLQESLRDFTSGELNRYLTQQNFIYGMYAVFYRDDEYGLYTEKESREMASTLRTQINDHLDDQEYISYLIWKYSQTYSGQSPDLISLDQFSDENIAALKSLGIGKVSAVLTEEDRYIVVFRMDPSENDDIVDQAAAIPAQEQLDAWCAAATVTAESTDPVDMAAAAGMLDTLGYLATL